MHAVAIGRDTDELFVEAVADGRVALRLNGLQLTPVDDGQDLQREPHEAARLEWLPDFDMVDHAALFNPPRSIPEETRMQEEMTLLCILETAERVQCLEPCNWHFAKFRAWLDVEISRAKDGTYPILGEESKAYAKLSSSTRHAMIEDRYQKLLHISSKGSVAIGIKRIYDHCEGLFTGQADTLDTLMRDDILTEIYNAVSFGKGDFFKLLAHARPDLRVLEVGAGTGGTTEMILRNLVRSNGLPAYSIYTFSDISAGFFPQARERFCYAPNMDYRVFDISQNPFDQGFKANWYDVVLAPNVIHATKSLRETLSNLQLLLRPGGLLVLTELCAVVRTPNYIFGNFSGWWLGEADQRQWEPYVTVDRWDIELKAAGFSGVDTAVHDAEEPFHYCAAIVSTKVEDGGKQKAAAPRPEVSILTDNPEGFLAEKLISELRNHSISVGVYGLFDTTLPANRDILSLLDLEAPFFENITQDRLEAFQGILQRHQSGHILWLTEPAQVNCEHPRSAQAIGVARSIRAESQIPLYTLEIKPTEPRFPELVCKVLTKVQRTEDNESLAPDKEYIVDGGIVKTGRYQPFLVRKELEETTPTHEAEGDLIKSLHITNPGFLDQLTWINSALPQPGEGGVVIDTKAVGLNFKDVLFAMGVLEPESGQDAPLGLEIAGVVSAIGPRVTGVAIGDRVMAAPPGPSFKTRVTCPAELVQIIPHSLSFSDAATMPICYITVIEALINIGRLEKGQSVLIHSAAGGVGHAAIQLCKDIGAEVYATVGSQKKAEYLTRAFSIPPSNIFHSRDESFLTHLKRETRGRGVDIVLNSVSGELLHASWECVAEFGKLIELGKRDLIQGGRLAMKNFLKSRSYCCVDVTHLIQMRSQRAGTALRKCIELYQTGRIGPLNPCAVFEAANIQEAFHRLQDGTHIGKVVVKLPTNSSSIVANPRVTKLRFRSNASYLLTGGMGGLGVSISRWLVEHGAKSLVYLSRSAGQRPGDQELIRELETSGCSVTTVAGHAESLEHVQQAISLAPQPIAGVIHLAMVLRDAPIAKMDHADWEAANAPKVRGAWNLHDSLKGHQLDFFVMASSMVTIVEQPGQGNYSAANTFLEAFTQYRRSLSLPASVINICPIDGVGFVAENAFARKNMKAQGLYFLGETELLDFLGLAIRLSPASTITTSHLPWASASDAKVDQDASLSQQHPWTSTGQMVMGLRSEGDLNDSSTRTNWRRDRRMGFYHNYNNRWPGRKDSSSRLNKFIADATIDPRLLDEASGISLIAQEIGKKVFALMLKDEDDLDINLTLHQVGLDSLMAIELRRWWKLTFSLEISVLELMASGTLDMLAAVAAKGLKESLAPIA
ncbi:Highly reducing polyketide synthase gloL [Fusarium oxysporum f. sp. cubense]|uniref:Highly reducing polyketide synthase gloL n=1 Tax=Fusarium oxysporum f. sp. cubense TaxID=61366 RepID=A0A559LLB4_FUSOC|nr:Highly reducing polyketide synthase gloL [Fusarium oxysporum f. sp. cubense]